MGAPAIPHSSTEAERRRLENTLDQDLSTLSLTATTSSSHLSPRRPSHYPPAVAAASDDDSFSSLSTIGVGRSRPAQLDSFDTSFPRFPSTLDTPKARAARGVSMRTETTLGGISPTSTAGHHVSAATLGAGVFRRPAARGVSTGAADEFDPDRSLGRLVGELAKAMGDERNKPASPFASPRSPSPSTRLPNLSFTLTRNDPLLSPPPSRSVSSASSGSREDRRQQSAPARPALGETNRHNAFAPQATLTRPDVLKKHKRHHAVQNDSADVTGMTGLLATPGRGTSFVGVDKNGAPEDPMAAAIPTALASLHARLRALETENSVSRRRVRELEVEIEKARDEVARAQKTKDGRLRDAVGEKTALEDLVKSLREHLARVTKELEDNKAVVAELRRAAAGPPSPAKYDTSVKDELGALRREVERLSREVARLGEIVAEGLAVRQREPEAPVRTVRLADPPLVDLSDDEIDAVRRDVEARSSVATRLASPHAPPQPTLPSQLRQGLHALASDQPGLMPPSAQPTTRVTTDSSEGEGAASPTPASRTRNSSSATVPRPRSRAAAAAALASPASSTSSTRRHRRAVPPAAGPDSPFPSIRVEDEASFFSYHAPSPAKAAKAQPPKATQATLPPSVRSLFDSPLLPPQTVLSRVIRELEDEFSHYKSIYVELADQYKVFDVASAVAKRHVLAEHLKEVIDTLEHKADQISALYSLLSVSDRPVSPNTDAAVRGHKTKSVHDLWRAVRDSLSDDARRRLEADGLFRK
ncbi:hypothetical protein Q8F55_004569 [Vanrija albida]|uniref:Cep57 centrosome microtubule-binding domain-containing protein n=1 Tax=Vanrija albida TaxID=181172 RepID=A0ABR3Q7C3_9TREE